MSGTPLLTEFDCPLLELTSSLYTLPTSSIISPVSVVYVCKLNSNHIICVSVNLPWVSDLANRMTYPYSVLYQVCNISKFEPEDVIL